MPTVPDCKDDSIQNVSHLLAWNGMVGAIKIGWWNSEHIIKMYVTKACMKYSVK